MCVCVHRQNCIMPAGVQQAGLDVAFIVVVHHSLWNCTSIVPDRSTDHQSSVQPHTHTQYPVERIIMHTGTRNGDFPLAEHFRTNNYLRSVPQSPKQQRRNVMKNFNLSSLPLECVISMMVMNNFMHLMIRGLFSFALNVRDPQDTYTQTEECIPCFTTHILLA